MCNIFQGLVEAFEETMLNIEHRYCDKHMHDNFKTQFKKEDKQLIWNPTGASTEKTFEWHMQKLKEADQKAHDWLVSKNPKSWARCFFSTHTKCDAIQNNISESFNAYIAEARDMPILSMIEWIRKRLMKRFYVKYTGMQRYRGDICPAVQDKLEKLKYESRNCFCTPAGQLKYQVDYYSTQASVNLVERTCSCRMWDITGVPCKHAISAIYANRELPEAYVHKYFLKDIYLAIYNHVINPVPSKEEWECTGYGDIHPNIPRKPAGRPKKKRIRSTDEPVNPYKVSRAGGYIVCENYGKQGHNIRGCKAAVIGETAWQKRMRLKRQRSNEVIR